MKNDSNLKLKIDIDYTSLYIGLLIYLIFILYIAFKVTNENLNSFIIIVLVSGILGYIWDQMVFVSFEIYTDSFVIKHPLRPIYREVRYSFNSIRQLNIYDRQFGRNPPDFEILFSDATGVEKKKRYSWVGNRKRVQKMIDALRSMGVKIYVDSNQMQ